MSLLHNSIWAAAAAVSSAISRFALAAILTRTLSEAIFGQYAYGQWLVDIIFLVCSLGATSAASRYVAEYRHDPTLVSAFIGRWQPYAVGLPFLSACIVILGASLSGMRLQFAGYLALAAWTLMNGLWAMQTAALIGMQRFDCLFGANLIFALIALTGAFVLPLSNDPAPVFGLMAVGSLCAFLFGIKLTFRLWTPVNQLVATIPWRKIIGYAFNMWIYTLLASLVWSRGEFPLVKSILGDAAVAHYAAALVIYGAAVQAIMIGVSGVAPHLTSLWGQGKRDEALQLSRIVMDFQLGMSAIGSMAVIFFGSYMVSIAFSPAYNDAAYPLSILCLGLASFVISSQAHLVQLDTDGRFSRNSIVFGLIVLYVMAAVLTPQFGLVGAAIARISAVLAIALATAAFAITRWGLAAVSVRNATAVSGILVGALLVESGLSTSGFAARFLSFSAGVALTFVLLRSQNGDLVVLHSLRMLRNRTL